MDKMDSNQKYRANLRIYHGGNFVTKQKKTEYVGGGLLMKFESDEFCYFNLLYIVKNDLNLKEGYEMWYRRPGLSLFTGKKRIESDKDIESLMTTKDINGIVNIYVVPTPHSLIQPLLRPNAPTRNPTSSSSTTSLNNSQKSAQTPLNKPQKLHCFRSKNPSIPNIYADSRVPEVHVETLVEGDFDDDEDDESDDPDVILSEGDFDDDEDDDLFAEAVDEDVSELVRKGLGSLSSKGAQVEESDDEDEGGNCDEIHINSDVDLPSDEDELASNHGSDGEGESEVNNYPTFNPETDFKAPINLSLGLKFPTNNVLRKALRHHSVENGYDYYLLHNGSKRVSVYCKQRCDCVWVSGRAKLPACICKNKKCNFKVHAKKLKDEETFQIMSLRPAHKCGWNDRNKKCSALYLAEKYTEYWRLDSTTKIEKFQRQVMIDIGVDITYWKAYYAKQKALKMIYGESTEQYKRVWDYADTLKKYNVGSSVFVKLTNIDRPPPIFQRMYVCLEACKAGFIAGCRPILGVDGCHLKGPHPGMLLVAVGKDGNCNIYPVAWAIVEVENTATWIWFLELLMKDLEALGENITFISDRQKGLLEAFHKVVPNAEIRYCCRHIWANFKQSFPGEAFKQCFWKIARAYTKEDFDTYMAEMKEMSVPAFTYLNSIPTEHWARHAFRTHCKSGMMVNNCCESFNNVLRKCRDKPALELLEWIRRYNMTRIWSKSEGVAKLEGEWMPSVVKQLAISGKEYRHCKIEQSGPHEYEVEDKSDRWIVNLEKRTCKCFRWELTGIPCVHAYACIMKKRGEPTNYVHGAYSKAVYVKAYSHFIKAVPGPKQWEKTDYPQPLPPAYRKMPGRPSLKKRRREAGETEGTRTTVKKKGTKKTCGNCGNKGHNKKGCKNPPRLIPTNNNGQTSNQQEVVQLSQVPPNGSQV